MQPLLCALAGLALLRASGADAGEWGPGGRGPGKAWPRWVSEEDGGVREMETEPDGEREMEKERKTDGETKQKDSKAEK